MTILVMALYAEGSVDTRFLPPLIQRTTETILFKHSEKTIDIPEIIIISKKKEKLENCIYQAAKEAKDCHALFIHNDGDNLGYDLAHKNRFIPGFTLVQESHEDACRHLVSIIPVTMIEAWMLADSNALLQVLGTKQSPQMTNLLVKAPLVEGIAKPKDTLNKIINEANIIRSRHRQTINLSTKYELLARQIDLNKLFEVPSYKIFVNELAKTLEELHFITYGSAAKIISSPHFHISK